MPSTASTLPLSERWRPTKLDEIVGNAEAVRELRRWADGWGPERSAPAQRAALLEGPPGVGKTTAAGALARERGWNLVEMNASDARNRTSIERVAGRAAITHALGAEEEFRTARSGGRTLILLDEADCLTGRATEEVAQVHQSQPLREFLRGRYGSVDALNRAWGLGSAGAPAAFARWDELPASAGRAGWTRLRSAQQDIQDWRGAAERPDLSDRGGLGAIAALVRTTLQPVVLTVNDAQTLTRYSPVFKQKVARIRFGPVGQEEIRRLLRSIILRERFAIDSDALELIVRRSQGDVRAALSDLDAIQPLPAGPDQLKVLGGRDRATDFEMFAAEALGTRRYMRGVEIRSRLDAPPDEMFPWIEENLPRAAPDAAHRYAALQVLARADLYLQRARRYRHFGLWSYASELMVGGVGVALERPETGPPADVYFPTYLAGMGRTKFTRAQRRGVLLGVGRALHLSVRKGNEEFLPALFRYFDPRRPQFTAPGAAAVRAWVVRRGRLGREEIAFLLGVEPDATEVTRELEAAEVDPDTISAPGGPGARRSPPVRAARRRTGPTTGPLEKSAEAAKARSKRPPSQKRLAEF
ncbi:MAG TPA: AAA family ATPase [Thermoplasmata archaeon]|nr:AAA family ATPase [Thermoplasmata archaeon]